MHKELDFALMKPKGLKKMVLNFWIHHDHHQWHYATGTFASSKILCHPSPSVGSSFEL